tara:strand:- start:410 stop:820 length:411 start_codon:yes stop_codon:yes gene_type:complete
MSGIIGHAGSKSGVIGDHNLKQYDLTITSLSSVTSAKGIPYKTSNGHWWLRGNIIGTISGAGSNNIFAITVSGVTFIANSAVTLMHGDAQTTNINGQGYTTAGSNISIIWNGVVDYNSIWGFSFDVRVASKPTWAD